MRQYKSILEEVVYDEFDEALYVKDNILELQNKELKLIDREKELNEREEKLNTKEKELIKKEYKLLIIEQNIIRIKIQELKKLDDLDSPEAKKIMEELITVEPPNLPLLF